MRSAARAGLGLAISSLAVTTASRAAFAPSAGLIRASALWRGEGSVVSPATLAARTSLGGRMRMGLGVRAMSLSATPQAQAQERPMLVLYDGKCPLCLAEISFLEKRSNKHGYTDKITFVDVAEEGYDPANNGGVSYEDAMRVMTVVRGDGTVTKGMSAFEDIYAQVGLPWVFSMLKYTSIRRFADRVYDFWAVYRLPISGRGSLDAHLAERMREAKCDTGTCEGKRGM